MADQRVVTSTTLRDPLDRGAIEAIVTGRHGAPFDVLGPHTMSLEGEAAWIVRAFLPGAAEVWLEPDSKMARDGTNGASSGSRPMRALHAAGLFSIVGSGEPISDYRLRVRWTSGVESRILDPYAFGPLLSDYDLYLIGEGSHLNLYERLGSASL